MMYMIMKGPADAFILVASENKHQYLNILILWVFKIYFSGFFPRINFTPIPYMGYTYSYN